MSQNARIANLFKRLEEVINANLMIGYCLNYNKRSLFQTVIPRNCDFRHHLGVISTQCSNNQLLVKRSLQKPVCFTLDCLANSRNLTNIVINCDEIILKKTNENLITIMNPSAYSIKQAVLNLDDVYQDLMHNMNPEDFNQIFERPQISETPESTQIVNNRLNLHSFFDIFSK